MQWSPIKEPIYRRRQSLMRNLVQIDIEKDNDLFPYQWQFFLLNDDGPSHWPILWRKNASQSLNIYMHKLIYLDLPRRKQRTMFNPSVYGPPKISDQCNESFNFKLCKIRQIFYVIERNCCIDSPFLLVILPIINNIPALFQRMLGADQATSHCRN